MKQLGRPTVALIGNPNTGKSTVFNYLTGLNQHTGNWPGKTVASAVGSYSWRNVAFTAVDLPGTYSLYADSIDEKVTRDYILFDSPDAVVIVVDACCLERNLNLVLQVLEVTPKALVCVNLMDEAARKGLIIDDHRLELELGVPVIPCVARIGKGMDKLKDVIFDIVYGHIHTHPRLVNYGDEIETTLAIVTARLSPLSPQYTPRWLALRLVVRDDEVIENIATRNASSFVNTICRFKSSGQQESALWPS